MEMQIEENLSFTEENEEKESPQITHNVANRETLLRENEKLFLQSQTAETHVVNEETQKEQSKTQEPLYRLNNIDTEMQIKTEIKELICTRVSEELNATFLNNMNKEREDQITNLRNLISNQQSKNEHLRKELETDKKRLVESEQVLLRTNEIIQLLEDNMEKIMVMYAEIGINKLLENTLKQRENWETLKKSCVLKLNEEKKCLVNEESRGTNLITSMEKERDEKKEMLENLKVREEELKKILAFYEVEIERNLVKKAKIQNTVDANSQKKEVLVQELSEQKDIVEKLAGATDAQNTKFNEIDKKKSKLEENFQKITQELDDARKTASLYQNQILEKQETFEKLKETLSIESEKHRICVDKLQQDFDDISSKLEETEKQSADCRCNIEKLLTEMDILKSNYIKKCEQEMELMNRSLQQQNTIHEAKMELLRKQTTNDIERAKFEELQNIYETSIKTLSFLEKDITKEQERVSMEVMQTRVKFTNAQTDYVKFTSDMNKKKDYLQENSAFLEEKCENMKREITECEKKNANLQDENQSLESLVQNKVTHLEELKNKLNSLKKGTLKSGLKSPKTESVAKKVKFNEVLSFKSASSSDVQSENLSQLSNCFAGWLKRVTPSNSEETVEKEF